MDACSSERRTRRRRSNKERKKKLLTLAADLKHIFHLSANYAVMQWVHHIDIYLQCSQSQCICLRRGSRCQRLRHPHTKLYAAFWRSTHATIVLSDFSHFSKKIWCWQVWHSAKVTADTLRVRHCVPSLLELLCQCECASKTVLLSMRGLAYHCVVLLHSECESLKHWTPVWLKTRW